MKKPIGLLALALFARVLASAQPPAVTNEEALRLAHKLESEVNAGNPTTLNHLIDPELLVSRTSEKSPILKNVTYRKGFLEGVALSTGVYGQQTVANIKGGGYHLVRVFESGGVRHMLFRLHDGRAALNYFDFLLVKVNDSIRAADVYIYASDEYMSTTISRLVNNVNADKKEAPAELQFVAGMIERFQKKDFAGIKQFFENNDSKMKEDKGMYLFYVNACKLVDANKYQEVLEHYITHFPDAASGYLMMIDLYYTKKDPVKGLASVEKMDSLIGKDTFLNYYRGRCYDMLGRKEETVRCFEATYRYDPLFERNTIRLIVAYAVNKENDKAKTVIGEYKRTPAFAPENLDAVYSRFPDLK